jgi:hypothetical protein
VPNRPRRGCARWSSAYGAATDQCCPNTHLCPRKSRERTAELRRRLTSIRMVARQASQHRQCCPHRRIVNEPVSAEAAPNTSTGPCFIDRFEEQHRRMGGGGSDRRSQHLGLLVSQVVLPSKHESIPPTNDAVLRFAVRTSASVHDQSISVRTEAAITAIAINPGEKRVIPALVEAVSRAGAVSRSGRERSTSRSGCQKNSRNDRFGKKTEHRKVVTAQCEARFPYLGPCNTPRKSTSNCKYPNSR